MNASKTVVWPSIFELVELVRSGKTTCLEQVKKAHDAIDAKSDFNAVIEKIDKRAIERAKMLDQKILMGDKQGKLLGVPFIAKDNLLTFGSETTAASNILKGFKAPYQATVIEKLEAEGAICVAKANLDAFAHGTSTENSDFMVTKNPHDKERVAGGSSGGPAASVVLGLAPFAIGTDTGGSIRQPASFCGAVGYKPTYGLVSRSGVIAMVSSTDTIGPITKSVVESALILDVIAGKDRLDSTTISKDKEGYQLPSVVKSKVLKVGLVSEYMTDSVDSDVKKCINNVTAQLKSSQVEVVEVSLPSLALALACYYIIAPAEISSNLSRYDGLKYGFSDENAENLDSSYLNSRSIGFGNEAKRRILIGTYVLSSGYYDAYYNKAQKLRTKIIEDFKNVFKSVDMLIGPVAPSTAFKIGVNSNDPLKMYLQDIMTVAPSLAGLPAISIPVGVGKNMLPVGLQIIAPAKRDRDLLAFSKSVEELVRES
jgi:aspartyl-tRNA(Asn)/glutamyl-tRNA(Gln) amidotransferase subunit A